MNKKKTALKDLHPICKGEGNYQEIVDLYNATEPKIVGNRQLVYIADALNKGNYKLEWLRLGLTSSHDWSKIAQLPAKEWSKIDQRLY